MVKRHEYIFYIYLYNKATGTRKILDTAIFYTFGIAKGFIYWTITNFYYTVSHIQLFATTNVKKKKVASGIFSGIFLGSLNFTFCIFINDKRIKMMCCVKIEGGEAME